MLKSGIRVLWFGQIIIYPKFSSAAFKRGAAARFRVQITEIVPFAAY
jgi:hypothetical protein